MDLFELRRPDHVNDDTWGAIEAGLLRLKRACDVEDLHEVIGKAKELVETVARVAIAASDGTVADRADLGVVVGTAHKQLRHSVGQDLSQDENVRSMANAAQALATKIAPLRNAFGTGHGRASVPPVAQEMADVVLEGALLWCRWALRRLGHMLADYPNELISAVHSATGEKELGEKFAAVLLAQQPSDVQRSIGVAFGRESAGGFGNATAVGVDPTIHANPATRDENFPTPYRHGLVEGMLFSNSGAVGLTDFYAGRFANIVATLPEGPETEEFLHALTETAEQASWPKNWRRTTEVDAAAVVGKLRFLGLKLPTHLQATFSQLCDALASIVETVHGD